MDESKNITSAHISSAFSSSF